jgi:hypothetical protein
MNTVTFPPDPMIISVRMSDSQPCNEIAQPEVVLGAVDKDDDGSGIPGRVFRARSMNNITQGLWNVKRGRA